MRDIDYELIEAFSGPRDDEHIASLIEQGADVTVTDEEGRTPLHCPYEIGTVKLLIDHGADVMARDNNGMTPLHYAVDVGGPFIDENCEIVKLLIEHGADVMARDDDGDTPLHATRDVKITKLLVEHGADVMAVDDGGKTTLHCAVVNDADGGTVALLIEHGVDITAKCCIQGFEGVTALLLAGAFGREESVNVLIKHGAILSREDVSLFENIIDNDDEPEEIDEATNNFVKVLLNFPERLDDALKLQQRCVESSKGNDNIDATVLTGYLETLDAVHEKLKAKQASCNEAKDEVQNAATNCHVCSNCGNNLPVGAKFCPFCGNKIAAFCPNCGTKITQGAKFCHECGCKM